MSAMFDERPVVVGVPDDDVEDALRFAAQEARRSGCGLWVVHSHHAGMSTWGEAVLHRAVARAVELAGPGTPVTGQLVAGIPVEAVLAAFPQARAVVLRHRDVLHLLRTLTSERAAEIRTPVVCVPQHWDGPDPDQRPVSVGVEHTAEAGPLVRAAADQAAARGASLRVVHVWNLRSRPDPQLEERVGGEWDSGARADLDRAVAACGTTVPVTVEVDHGDPTETLLAVARDSQLLVLARNEHRADVGSRMGRAARALLHQSDAPLLVLPPPRAGRRAAAGSPASAWGLAETPVLL